MHSDNESPIYMNHPIDNLLDKNDSLNPYMTPISYQESYIDDDYVDMGPTCNAVLPITNMDKWYNSIGDNRNNYQSSDPNKNNNCSSFEDEPRRPGVSKIYPRVRIISVVNVLLFILLMLPLVYLVFVGWRTEMALTHFSKENTVVIDKKEYMIMTQDKYRELLEKIHQLEFDKRRGYPPFPLVSYTTQEINTVTKQD